MILAMFFHWMLIITYSYCNYFCNSNWGRDYFKPRPISKHLNQEVIRGIEKNYRNPVGRSGPASEMIMEWNKRLLFTKIIIPSLPQNNSYWMKESSTNKFSKGILLFASTQSNIVPIYLWKNFSELNRSS